METGLTENTMSFEESLKQISPSDKNAKPIKVSLLKQLRKRYYWRLENNQWIVYDKKQNREFTMKVNNSNDALLIPPASFSTHLHRLTERSSTAHPKDEPVASVYGLSPVTSSAQSDSTSELLRFL